MLSKTYYGSNSKNKSCKEDRTNWQLQPHEFGIGFRNRRPERCKGYSQTLAKFYSFTKITSHGFSELKHKRIQSPITRVAISLFYCEIFHLFNFLRDRSAYLRAKAINHVIFHRAEIQSLSTTFSAAGCSS